MAFRASIDYIGTVRDKIKNVHHKLSYKQVNEESDSW